MKLRPDIVALLRQGLSDRAIGRQLRCDPKGVARTRAALGLPQVKSGPPPAPVEDLFWARVEPVEGGHLRWTGHHNSTGVPSLRVGGRSGGLRSAYRIAFTIRTGREPQGTVSSDCDHPGCVAPRHVADAAERARDRKALAALLGDPA
jgi:hypothetical protein